MSLFAVVWSKVYEYWSVVAGRREAVSHQHRPISPEDHIHGNRPWLLLGRLHTSTHLYVSDPELRLDVGPRYGYREQAGAST